MRVVSVTFDYGESRSYARLMATFRASCARHMPDAAFDELRLTAPQLRPGYSQGHNSNTVKLRAWAKYMRTATEPVVFCDCDMLCLGDLAPAFAGNFDVAYTERTQADKIALNGGVVFVKPTDGARALVERWCEINEKMFTDHTLHDYWRSRVRTPKGGSFCGMNQAAFGCLLHTAKKLGRIAALPCAVWNACNEDWPAVGPETRMVHIKGELRHFCLTGEIKIVAGKSPHAVAPVIRKLGGMWREYGF